LTRKFLLDGHGTAWIANRVVTWRRLLRRLLLILSVVQSAVLALLVGVLIMERQPLGGHWVEVAGSLAATLFAWALCVYGVWRPGYHPGAPARVGFSRTHLHLQNPRGQIDSISWRAMSPVHIRKDRHLALRLDFVAAGTHHSSIFSLDVDVACLIQWAVRAAHLVGLEPEGLAKEPDPAWLWDSLPQDFVILSAATPKTALSDGALAVFRRGAWLGHRRFTVDAVVLTYLGISMAWITVQGRKAATTIDAGDIGRLQAWIAARDEQATPGSGNAFVVPPEGVVRGNEPQR